MLASIIWYIYLHVSWFLRFVSGFFFFFVHHTRYGLHTLLVYSDRHIYMAHVRDSFMSNSRLFVAGGLDEGKPAYFVTLADARNS